MHFVPDQSEPALPPPGVNSARSTSPAEPWTTRPARFATTPSPPHPTLRSSFSLSIYPSIHRSLLPLCPTCNLIRDLLTRGSARISSGRARISGQPAANPLAELRFIESFGRRVSRYSMHRNRVDMYATNI